MEIGITDHSDRFGMYPNILRVMDPVIPSPPENDPMGITTDIRLICSEYVSEIQQAEVAYAKAVNEAEPGSYAFIIDAYNRKLDTCAAAKKKMQKRISDLNRRLHPQK